MVLAKSLCHQSRGIDTQGLQMAHNVCCPIRGNLPVGRKAGTEGGGNRQAVRKTLNYDPFSVEALQGRGNLVERVYPVRADLPSPLRKKDFVSHGHLDAILELLDLDLVTLNLGLQALIQILIGIVHIERRFILWERLLILLSRPATGHQPYDHQQQG